MKRTIRRRVRTSVLAAGMLCASSRRAAAGMTVTSFTTTAETNAYAPFSQAQYFDKRTLTNASPAVLDVSDDWTGTNVGGTTDTWHWVGASHIETSTQFDATSLTVTGAGFFSYELTTSNGFVDPTRTGTFYTPAGAADYECYFTLDTPAVYRVTGRIDGWGGAVLSSSESGEFFFVNGGSIDRNGIIPPGHYEILANASFAAANLPNGVNDYARNGSFSDFSFSVEVPEPSSGIALVAAGIFSKAFRRRR